MPRPRHPVTGVQVPATAPARGRSAAGDERARLDAVRRSLRRSLTAWSLGSIGAGAVLAAEARRAPDESSILSGATRQLVAWGAVDLGIVAAGAVVDSRRDARGTEDPATAARSLRRLLWLNAGLDLGYLAAGAALVARRELRGRQVAGDGLVVLVQGAFLLWLDASHAWRLRPARP